MGNIVTDAFYFLSVLAIFCALMVVFSRNPMHSVLYLILCFFAISGHYFMLNAQFLLIVNIIVYAGAIMVLFLFVIMLLNLNAVTEPHKKLIVKFAAVISAGFLLLTMVASVKSAAIHASENVAIDTQNMGLVKELGKVLFSQYLLPFEISSILFLAAMVGAVMLGKKEMTEQA